MGVLAVTLHCLLSRFSQAAAGLLLLALSLLPGHWGYRWLPYMVSSYVGSGIQTPVLVLLRQVLPTEPPSPACVDFKLPPMDQTWTAYFISSSFSGLLFSFPALHENLDPHLGPHSAAAI